MYLMYVLASVFDVGTICFGESFINTYCLEWTCVKRQGVLFAAENFVFVQLGTDPADQCPHTIAFTTSWLQERSLKEAQA